MYNLVKHFDAFQQNIFCYYFLVLDNFQNLPLLLQNCITVGKKTYGRKKDEISLFYYFRSFYLLLISNFIKMGYQYVLRKPVIAVSSYSSYCKSLHLREIIDLFQENAQKHSKLTQPVFFAKVLLQVIEPTTVAVTRKEKVGSLCQMGYFGGFFQLYPVFSTTFTDIKF